MTDKTQNQLLVEKWQSVLNADGIAKITDQHRLNTTAQLLENTQQMLKEDATVAANIAGFDPVLISMIRRSAPKLIAYDICGVQAMTQPTGLVFAMKARYTNATGDEALFNKVKSGHSGDKAVDSADNPFEATKPATIGAGQALATAESDNNWNSMSATVEKVQVSAMTRQLRADYSLELMQDWKALHGVNADAELANILASDILIEQNREIVHKIYKMAKMGAQYASTAGTFDLTADSDGRWSVERYKGLLFAINRDANAIAVETRRGKGNFIITSADVASALQMAGLLDFAPAIEALSGQLQVDITGATYAGNIGTMKVFVDPFLTHNGVAIGYKGASAYDAGLIFAPYVPLQAFKAVDPKTFMPAMGFKTRYGLVANPFTTMNDNDNIYYRKFAIKNL